MKTINHYVLNGAIALLSTAGFVACSSSDDVTDAPVNPTYDGKSVKTQFAINVATPGSKNQTRMTSDNTQMSGSKFLGMWNIYLFPLTLTGDEATNGPSSNTSVSSIIPLGSIEANNSEMHIDGSGSDAKDYKVYNDVNVAVGTNNFLFYGEGPSGTDMSSNFEKGKLTANVNGKISVGNINFKPVQIAAQSTYSSVQTEFASYLNGIIGANYSDGTNTTNWNNIANDATEDLSVLKAAYTNFVTLKAGSAAAILASVQSLYNIMKPISENTSSNAKDLAGAICTAILNQNGTNLKIKVSSETTDPNYILSYESSDKNYTEFPETQGLPQGAMILEYSSSTSAFSYKTTSTSIGTTGNNVNVDNIVYPACLEYFVNTPLKATNSDMTTWPTTATAWDSDNWTNWGNSVLPSTRTIALQNTINYGVASLKTTIKAVTETGLLEDNQNHFYSNLDNQQIAVGDGFTVTGILIGGQPGQVDWNFLSSSDNFTMTVFDRSMPKNSNGKISVIAKNYPDDTSTSTPFYTLLLDNMVPGASATQKDVNFAIELVNTSNTDFYGVDGVVAAGQKFYLVGKMSLSSDTQTINFPADSDYRFPGKGTKRIFVQDYTTNLNVTFKSLKNAYVTIPDLRASNLQLGLSVDLTWQSGLTFDVPID